jgi:hypothetical protein
VEGALDCEFIFDSKLRLIIDFMICVISTSLLKPKYLKRKKSLPWLQQIRCINLKKSWIDTQNAIHDYWIEINPFMQVFL